MGNKLSFLNALFIAFLIGKIGHLGTLGSVSWFVIIMFLVADIFLDFCNRVGWINKLISNIQIKLLLKQIKKITKNEKA